jgi:hypothetical protein
VTSGNRIFRLCTLLLINELISGLSDALDRHTADSVGGPKVPRQLVHHYHSRGTFSPVFPNLIIKIFNYLIFIYKNESPQRDLFYTTLRDLREEVRQVLVQYHRKLNNFVMWAEEETKKSAQRHLSPAQLQSTTKTISTQLLFRFLNNE